MAYGTETVKQAVKIVGPGSPWVVAAKRLLSGVIDTGLPAGPSEALIFADGTVDGRIAALDVLIEAEHGPDSSAYIVTPSREVAEAAQAALPEYWARMTPQRVALNRHGDLGLADAYAIQDALRAELDRRGARTIGWKLAATAPG